MKTDAGSEREKLLAALPHVRRFAISLSGNHADGDDLLQATVERVLKKGAPDNVDMKKWMFRICKNIWIDGYRAKKVREKAALGQDITIHDQPDGEAVIMDRLKLKEVTTAMKTIPDDQRIVLSLIAIEGMSYKEAAKMLEIPIGTIMSRLARARQNLSAQLLDSAGRSSSSTSDAFRA